MDDNCDGIEPIPYWFDQGHINDSRARRLAQSTSNTIFMHTLKRPQVGMRAETSIQSKEGKWIQMTGTVTWVGEPTPYDVLKMSDSLLWSVTTREPKKSKEVDEARMYEYLLNNLGSLHGQRMTSISRLSHDQPGLGLGGADEFVAELTYRFDDTMYFPWVVEDIRPLRGSELYRYSVFNYESFEGCSCDRCAGRVGEITTGDGESVQTKISDISGI